MASSRRASKRLSSGVVADAAEHGDALSPADGFRPQPGPTVHDQHVQPPAIVIDSIEPSNGSTQADNNRDQKSKEGRYSFTLVNDGSTSRMAPSMLAGSGTGLGVSMGEEAYQGQVLPPMVSDPHLPILSTTRSSEIGPAPQQPAVAGSSTNAINKAAEAAAESQHNSEPRQPHRAYLGPTGPSQPYGMYPQNTVPVEDEHLEMHVPSHSIPVGFAGREQTFHRRLGPEGEEAQDSITADGYREPLPAYSERDDIAMLKRAPPTATTSVTTLNTTTNAQPAVVEPASNDDMYASGISAQTENNAQRLAPEGRTTPSPNPGSPSEASMTSERPTTGRNSGFSDSSQRPIYINDATTSSDQEKTEHSSQKSIFRGKRLWFLIGAAVLLIVFIGSLAGALSRRNHHRPPPPPFLPDHTSTSSYINYVPTPTDVAAATATPTDISTPPIGNWALPIDQARIMQRTCLSSSSEFNAWSCTFAGDPFFEVNITQPKDNSDALLSIGSARPKNGYPRYGTQPASINAQPLSLVNDLNDQGRGPAYFFSSVYNKTVILKKQDFNAPQRPPDVLRKRQLKMSPTVSHPQPLPAQNGGSPNSLFSHMSRKEAKVGDELWICTWENTLVEGFIYPGQNSSGLGYGVVDPNLPPPTTTMDSPDATGTAKLDPTEPVSAAAPTFTMDHPPPPLGKIFKLIETRSPTVQGAKPPYCRLMSVAPGGELTDVTDQDSGKPIQFILHEPTIISPPAGSIPSSSAARKHVVDNTIAKRSGDSACRCEWMNF